MNRPASTRLAASMLEQLVPGLGPLEWRHAELVENNSLVVERPADTVLFDEGNPCRAFVLLASGVVRVTRTRADGRELLLYRVRPGEICVLTLGCLMGRSSYPARGVSERPIRSLMLPAVLFDQLTVELPAFRSFVFGAFAERMEGLLDLAATVAFDRVDQRLASALLTRSRIVGSEEVPATHQELASEIGTVRELVTRTLERFATAGAVELARARVTLVDRMALERIAVPQE